MSKQPPRSDRDGSIEIFRNEDETITISCETDGVPGQITATEYNAWRIFGSLALFLEIELPKKLGKQIKISEGDLKAEWRTSSRAEAEAEAIAKELEKLNEVNGKRLIGKVSIAKVPRKKLLDK